MRPLDDLANNHSFCNEVERLAQDIYASYKQNGSGKDVEVSRCWVLALSSLLNRHGFVLESPKTITFPSPNNVIKIRGN